MRASSNETGPERSMNPRSTSLLACCAACAAFAGAPALAAGSAAWHPIAIRTFEQQAIHAGFADARSGVTVGAHGMVFSTRDGGRTWEEAVNHTGGRNALELHPEGFAWHAGNVEVRRSFDGGRTWYLAADFTGAGADPVLHLSFADEVRGFIATRGRLGITSDGGLSWAEVRLPAEAQEVAAVWMGIAPVRPGTTSPQMSFTRRQTVGRLLDATGRLWVTEDGGKSWNEVASPLAGERFHVAGRAPTVALRFSSKGEGVLAAFVEEGAGWRCRVYRWAAGGTRWQEETLPLRELGSLFLSSDANLLTWKSFDRNELRVYAPPVRPGGGR
jgi:photosystem II stability/assembly factor-like uncharacterized protein